MSKIEWTETTWNPVTGCDKVSAGCQNCYAEIMSRRLQAMGVEKYRAGFNSVKFHPKSLTTPLHWKRPRLVFVNSMSDLFHDQVSDDQIDSVFEIIRSAPHHIFQILTKRAERLATYGRTKDWPDNLWAGVTVENQKSVSRIKFLRNSGAKHLFLSIEPLLQAIPALDLDQIHWVIVGGEAGPHSRPMEEEWVLDIREQCLNAHVPFFFKQWGGANKKKAGKMLDGEYWLNFPKEMSLTI
ncbi:MAG: phage Gp37/Gp68 family protein [bacterium]|nr:phage Gp37/Gp68 family protein [bacterium]